MLERVYYLSEITLPRHNPKKFAEGGVCTRERVPLSRIQACARSASLKRLSGN